VETAFQPKRLVAIRKLKGIHQQQALAALIGVRKGLVCEWEGGTSEPSLAQLKHLAAVLDCTSDYLIGSTWNETDDVRLAASHMSFDIFAKQPSVSEDWKQRCFRVLGHEAAPVTTTAWRHLAEQIDRALGPGPGSGQLKIVRENS
jgi:transcriptional regulator with XRE-family HTH domain